MDRLGGRAQLSRSCKNSAFVVIFVVSFCFPTPGSSYAGEAHRGGPWGAEGQEPGGGGLVRSPRAFAKDPKKKNVTGEMLRHFPLDRDPPAMAKRSVTSQARWLCSDRH